MGTHLGFDKVRRLPRGVILNFLSSQQASGVRDAHRIQQIAIIRDVEHKIGQASNALDLILKHRLCSIRCKILATKANKLFWYI